MKNFWWCLIFFLLFWFSLASYVDNQVLVQYAPSGMSLFSADNDSDELSFEVLEIEEWETVEEAIERLQNEPWVLHVQPNYVYTTYSLPNDPEFDQQWALYNTGQTVWWFAGTSWSDISWLEWIALFSGVTDQTVTGTLIALIDDGVNYNHIDLTGQFWDGSNCLSHTGAVLGWCTVWYDFYDNDFDPLPNMGDHHGTHIAGIIAAKMNNEIGIVWVNPSARIMALRAWSGNTLSTLDIIDAIKFAQHNGARIINASFGGPADDWLLEAAMEEFPGIIITAAGNGTIDGEWFEIGASWNPTIYPCAYDLPNILCVAATDAADDITEYSNFSDTYVDLAAPCSRIIGTFGVTGYVFADGTSSSVPHTVGIVSLAWSMYPDAPYEDIIQSIISWSVYISSMEGQTVHPRRVDLYGSLLYIQNQQTSPYPFTFTSLTGVLPLTMYTSDTVTLTWFVGSFDVVVNNGEYRINTGSWMSTTWTISSWDTLQLRTTSSWVPDQFDGAYISVGDYGASFLVAPMESWLLGWENIFFTWDRRHYNVTGFSLFIESDTGVDYRIFGENLMTEYTDTLWSNFNEIVLELNGATGITYVWTVLGSGWDERYFTDYVVYDIQSPILESISLTSGQIIYGTSVLITGTVSDDFALDVIPWFDLDCDTSATDVTECTFSWEAELQSWNFTIIIHVYDKAWNFDQFTIPLFVDQWDRTPDAFTFAQKNNVARSTVISSDIATVVGIDTGVIVSVSAGEYRINNTGARTSATGMLYSGDDLQLRLTSSSSYNTTVSMTASVWWYDTSFSVRTESAPSSWGGWGWWGGGWGGLWWTVTNDNTVDVLDGQNDGEDIIEEKTQVYTWDVEEVVYEFFDTTSVIPLPTAALVVPQSAQCAWPEELQQAYQFAYGIGITTMPTADQARLCDGVTRAEMAKMMVNYAQTVASLSEDSSRACNFDDIASQPTELQWYIVQACKLGIMGVGITSFSPNASVDRWQFGTALSRVLYGNIHNWWSPYYIDHLSALLSNGIITNIDSSLQELRWYVMLMMMRAVE